MILNPVLPETSPYYTSRPTGNVNRTASAMSAVDDTLDLSVEARDILGTLAELPPSERNQYLENLARLLQAGIVGTETLNVNGRPHKGFAGTRFADPHVTGARLYRTR